MKLVVSEQNCLYRWFEGKPCLGVASRCFRLHVSLYQNCRGQIEDSHSVCRLWKWVRPLDLSRHFSWKKGKFLKGFTAVTFAQCHSRRDLGHKVDLTKKSRSVTSSEIGQTAQLTQVGRSFHRSSMRIERGEAQASTLTNGYLRYWTCMQHTYALVCRHVECGGKGISCTIVHSSVLQWGQGLFHWGAGDIGSRAWSQSSAVFVKTSCQIAIKGFVVTSCQRKPTGSVWKLVKFPFPPYNSKGAMAAQDRRAVSEIAGKIVHTSTPPSLYWK